MKSIALVLPIYIYKLSSKYVYFIQGKEQKAFIFNPIIVLSVVSMYLKYDYIIINTMDSDSE